MEYCTKYIDNLFCNEFEKLANQDYVIKENLKVLRVANATVLPFVPTPTNTAKGTGGVLDEKGQYVVASATTQEDLMVNGYEYDYGQIPIEQETVIYLGYFIKQWGHFLVDFLPRLWWISEHYNGEKVLILANNPRMKIDGNYMKMLNALGITEEKICIVQAVKRFREVIVPEMSMVRPIYYTKECRSFFSKLTNKIIERVSLKPYSKIYWTRTHLKKAKMSEIGEKEIETFFRKNGYKVLSPEKCSLEELVYYIHNCEEFASLSGTIPHNVVFAKPGTRCIVLNKTYRINTIQLMLNELTGVETLYIDSHLSLLPASPGAGPFWMHVGENLLNFAKDENFVIPSKYQRNKNRISLYINAWEKSKLLKKYFLIYCRLKDVNLDIGGSICGHARPEDGFEDKKIYFFYRRKLGLINTDTNVVSFFTNLYHYWKGEV